MPTDPLISIIITCYNYGKYLEQSVISALNQTYQHVEVLVVDDGSPEIETQNMLDKIESKYPLVRIYRKPNSGPSGARNFGIKQSKADYFIQLDADDYIATTYAEACIELLAANPLVSPVYTDVSFFGDQKYNEQMIDWDFKTLKSKNFICSCPAFSRKSWEACGGYDENLFGIEDYELFLHMAMKGFKGQRIPQYLLFKRYHLSEMGCVGSVSEEKDPTDFKGKYIKAKHRLTLKSKFYHLLGIKQDLAKILK